MRVEVPFTLIFWFLLVEEHFEIVHGILWYMLMRLIGLLFNEFVL